MPIITILSRVGRELNEVTVWKIPSALQTLRLDAKGLSHKSNSKHVSHRDVSLQSETTLWVPYMHTNISKYTIDNKNQVSSS